MGEIKAGVVVVTEFCKSDSSVFGGYIEYIDRDEAVRNVHQEEFNIYQDYMGNPYKTTGLFTNNGENLTQEEKAVLKDTFRAAQENGSLMWQTVISFDNRWLKENGLWTGYLNKHNERKIQEISRKAVTEMLEKEGLQNAVWSAAIHLNTDNLHVHIAIVEPVPMRSKKKYIYYKEYQKGREKEKIPVKESVEYRGKFKMSSIEKCKSVVVNEIINQKEMNIEITRLIRESIVQKKREQQIRENEKLLKSFLELYNKLEKIPKGKWNYNDKAMTFLRGDIDKLSHAYMELYHKEDFAELKEKLITQDERYRKGYGKTDSSFVQGKVNDLYTRLGNAILKELKEYDKGLKSAELKQKETEKKVVNKNENEWEEERESPRSSKGKSKADYDIKWNENIYRARSFAKQGKKEEAAEIYEKESLKKNVLAILEMGQIYQYGIGREKNVEKAEEYYKESLKQFERIYESTYTSGDEWEKFLSGYAAYKVGKQYEKGRGTEADVKEALRWYEKGAEKQNPYAFYAMGKMYADREDMKEIEKAVGCLEQAIEHGHGEHIGYSYYQLGNIYLNEEGYKDLEKAEACFEKSTEHGAADGYAYYRLGRIYQDDETKKDVNKAVKCLKEAGNWKATEGYAAYSLGKIYLNEEEVRDIKKAVAYFEKAAEHEQMKGYALYELGRIYKENYRDREKATFYFQKASEAGNAYAEKQIEFLEREYGKTEISSAKKPMRRFRRTRNSSAKKAMNGFRNALDNEYESYKNQQVYLWNIREQQREAGMER